MARDEHNLHVGMRFVFLEQVHPVAIRQNEIDQNDVGTVRGNLPLRLLDIAGDRMGKPFRANDFGQSFPRVGIVVDDQRMGHGIGLDKGCAIGAAFSVAKSACATLENSQGGDKCMAALQQHASARSKNWRPQVSGCAREYANNTALPCGRGCYPG